ncbi:MAG: PAS domain S-box protein [Planctomycetota bacterium]
MNSTGILGGVWDDRFRAILNSALDAVVAMDAAGRVIEWNRRAEQVFGWTKEEASEAFACLEREVAGLEHALSKYRA